jgi:hypothetical protein
MAQDKFQGARFEQKYIITEENALQIRDFVRSRLELDEHAVGKPNFSYPVHSLYLDSHDLKLYWATINGDKSRFKMRLRFYDDNPNTPVFLEIKELTSIQRPVKESTPVIKIKELTNSGCHIKKRAPVHRGAVDGLLTDQTDDPSRLTDAKHFGALEDFCERMYELEAQPKVSRRVFPRSLRVRRRQLVPVDDGSGSSCCAGPAFLSGNRKEWSRGATLHHNAEPDTDLGARCRSGGEVYEPPSRHVSRSDPDLWSAAMWRCQIR